MTKLSEKQGGGIIYSPAMMEFDGSTGYFSGASLATAGNKVTVVCRFRCASFSGAGLQYFARMHGGTSNRVRFGIVALASDHADVDRQDKIQFFVADSAGANICLLVTPSGYLDGEEHVLFASFDGDIGAATFIIDGLDVDDTGNADRVAPTTGTLETSASDGVLAVGANVGGGSNLDGDVGYFGHREAYLTNWSDFMDQYGNPKELDESGWTEWGAQPLFWNKHGDMTNNLGSAGDMTKNGTIDVGDGGAGPFPHIGLPTVGTAAAADLRENENSWVDGLEIVGVLGANRRQVIDFKFPIGAQTGYTVNRDDFDYIHPDIGSFTAQALDINADGYAYPNGARDRIVFNSGPGSDTLPEIMGNARIYEAWGRSTAYSSLTLYDGIRFYLNDDSSGNYWTCVHQINGSNWDPYIAEFVSSVWNFRAAPTDISAATVGDPTFWNFQIWDWGDQLTVLLMMLKEGSTASTAIQTTATHFNETNRTNKGLENMKLQIFSDSGGGDYSDMMLRGFRVYDV